MRSAPKYMVFCPNCGKEAVDVFCEACLREREPLIVEVKPFSLIACGQCGRVLYHGHWEQPERFTDLLRRALVFNPRAVITDVRFPQPVLTERPKEFVLPIDVEGTVSEHIEPYGEEYEVAVSIEYSECDRCAKAKSSYFEGTLQLRNPNEQVVSYIERRMQKEPEVLITKARDVRGGIDFSFTDQQFLHSFAHELHRRFGGTIKTQSRLHTYDSQTSKQVFRLTALVRLPDFWRNDVIELDKRLVRITRMGSTLKCFDLRRRKRTTIPCPENAVPLDIHETVLSAIKPKPTILDPDTFQEVQLAHSVDIEPGTRVPVVQDSRGKWYVAQALPSEQ